MKEVFFVLSISNERSGITRIWKFVDRGKVISVEINR